MGYRGWYGVDLDGTLAHYVGWDGGKIGPPIARMVERVRGWLADGQRVKIVTARVALDPKGERGRDVEEQRARIEAWCEEHIGVKLEVTCQKDFGMIALYDDRCTQVIGNTGRLVTEYPYPNEESVAITWGLHAEEARPRGETWLHERRNWQIEVEQLRATIAAMEATMKANVHDEWDRVARMREIQGRIQIEREIAAFPPEKREALDRFVASSDQMTCDELDAVIGAFGDAEGTYVQRLEAGQKALQRWAKCYDQPFIPREASDQEVVEAVRGAGFKVGWNEGEKTDA